MAKKRKEYESAAAVILREMEAIGANLARTELLYRGRFDQVRADVERLDGRIASIDAGLYDRIAAAEAGLDGRIAAIEAGYPADGFADIAAAMEGLNNRLTAIEAGYPGDVPGDGSPVQPSREWYGDILGRIHALEEARGADVATADEVAIADLEERLGRLEESRVNAEAIGERIGRLEAASKISAAGVDADVKRLQSRIERMELRAADRDAQAAAAAEAFLGERLSAIEAGMVAHAPRCEVTLGRLRCEYDAAHEGVHSFDKPMEYHGDPHADRG